MGVGAKGITPPIEMEKVKCRYASPRNVGTWIALVPSPLGMDKFNIDMRVIYG